MDTVGADALAALGAGAAAFGITALLMPSLIAALRRHSVLDIPNHRSSHHEPTPRGAGLLVTLVIVAGWGIVLALTGAGPYTPMALMVLAGAAALGVLSWVDDRVNLPRRLRLPVHVAVVAGAVAGLPPDAVAFQGLLPLWADRLATVLAWVWFLNLYNFMDGIDGLCGVQTASLGVGLAVLALGLGVGAAGGVPLASLGLIAAGAALAFLVWNWHPAKVFLGDVGSIPLGFLLGWLLLLVALAGHLAAAFILPAVYLADTAVTVLERAARRLPAVFGPHRAHFYQRAVHVGGLRPDQVGLRVLLANAVLLALASWAVAGQPAMASAAAAVVVAGLLAHLHRPALSGVGG